MITYTAATPTTYTELIEACGLVEQVYKERGYVQYLEKDLASFMLFVLYEQTTERGSYLIGTTGLFRSEDDEPFPTERFFGFDITERLGLSRSKVAEVSRLAIVPSQRDPNHLSLKSLITVLNHYLLEKKFEAVVFCLKPALLRIMKGRFGIPFQQIEEVAVVQNSIPVAYRNYFWGDPPPIVVWGNLEEMQASLLALEDELGEHLVISRPGDGFPNHLDIATLNKEEVVVP